MTAIETLENLGYEDVIVFDNPSYDDALIGVTTNNQAVYDYEQMVEWLVNHEGMDHESATDFISYNCSYMPADGNYPLIMYSII